MTCLSACWVVVMLVIGGVAEGLAAMRAGRLVFVLLVTLPLVNPTVAQQSTIATTGMWAEMQCHQVYSGSIEQPFDDTPAVALDVALLMTMQYETGIWTDNSPIPFGRTFAHRDMVAVIRLNTPCDVEKKLTRVYENREGDYTVVVFRDTIATYADTDEPCVYRAGQPNPRRCGLHHGIFGYVTAEEWQRVSGR